MVRTDGTADVEELDDEAAAEDHGDAMYRE
jgi:hypothetical protein